MEESVDEELWDYAAATVIAFVFGCTCGDCWQKCFSWRSCDGSSVIESSDPPCLSEAGAEVVSWAWSGEARAIAKRRRDHALPRIDGNKAHRLLNNPQVWKTVEAVTRILSDGAVVEGTEPEEIARLLKGAGLRAEESNDRRL
jgi:hypothetical protein